MAARSSSPEELSSIVTLNVGGTLYDTTLLTLVKDPHTMLASMFSGRFDARKDRHGHFFIDADGQLFRYILRYLQSGILPPVDKMEEVYPLAEFFCVESLKQKLEAFPCVSLKKIREGFLSGAFPEMSQHILQVLRFIQNLRLSPTLPTRMSSTTSPVEVDICVRSDLTYDPPPEHECGRQSLADSGTQVGRVIPVDVVLGPDGVTCSPYAYMTSLCSVMKAEGYSVGLASGMEVRCVDRRDKQKSCDGELFHVWLDWLNVRSS